MGTDRNDRKSADRSNKVTTEDFLLVALASIIPIISPIILIGTIYDAFKRRRVGAGYLIITSFIFLVLGLFLANALHSFRSTGGMSKYAQTKANLRAIQINLERYRFDHDGQYPSDYSSLVNEHYLPGFPKNPFTNEPMKNIIFGSSPFEGEFTYFPYGVDGKVYGFYLVAYGAGHDEGQDIDDDGVGDNVILAVESGISISEEDRPQIPPIEIPPLADLARAVKAITQQVSTVEPENIE